jgi:ATP-dependent Clp protease ATP-binding subunit ClpC
MFERYTEKARRVIFFARYEASQFGSPFIETEHMLMGILREDKALTNRFLRSHASVESIRKQIETHSTIREKTSTSVDLPVSNECKRVMAYAAEEAGRLGHKHIGTEHLLLGLLREEDCFAAVILKERGVELNTVREEAAKAPQITAAGPTVESKALAGLFKDLTEAAGEGLLEPVVGRELEIDSVIEILVRRDKRNAVLVGEPGVGKTAIAEGLAQRIADGTAPAFLADKRILTIEPEVLSSWTKDRQEFSELTKLLGTLTNPGNLILFVDGFSGLLPVPGKTGAQGLAAVLRFAILHAEIQCICAGNASEYKEATQAMPWLGGALRTVHVRPLDEKESRRALQVRKGRLEKFHEVTYSEEALEFVAQASGSYLPERSLPGKAMELLDAAGALVKLRKGSVPAELAEVQKKLRFITNRMESAILNHEFEKARFYSDEERKERENLRALREKYHVEDFAIVKREDVEQVIARWSAYPYSA